jgi:hypothetical protein
LLDRNFRMATGDITGPISVVVRGSGIYWSCGTLWKVSIEKCETHGEFLLHQETLTYKKHFLF